jgi:GT2 family glycosyltransferase
VTETAYDGFHVILVDNASTDGSVDVVRNRFPAVEVIVNEKNLGFAEGNNVGIRRALERKADYVVLLNPDTRVTPTWLSELVKTGESISTVGIVGAVQLEYDSMELNSWTTTAFPGALEQLRDPETSVPSMSVEWVEGACFAIKRAVFDDIGPARSDLFCLL